MGKRPFAFLNSKISRPTGWAWLLRDWGENGRWLGVWVKNGSLNVYDNSGYQGPLGTYVTNMRRHNDFEILLKQPKKIEEMLID